MTNNIKTITSVPGWLTDFTNSGLPKSTAQLYATVPLVYRAIRLRADALSAVPIKIIAGKDEEKTWPFPTALRTLIWRAEAGLLQTGGAYWEIVSNKSGYKKDVRFRNSHYMDVSYDNGKLIFKQTTANGGEWINEPDKGLYQMVYFSDYDPAQDILPGVGAAEVGRIDARLITALSKFPEAYFEGGAMPVTLLGIDSSDTNEIARVENWFKRSATAIKNAFRVLGIRAGSIIPTTLTPDLEKMAMPELYNTAKKNIAVAFGIPESMLDTTAANFATAQEARLGFYEDQIKARAAMFEDVINTQLLAKEKLSIKFDFEAMSLFQEDEAARAKVLRELTYSGTPLELAFDLAGYALTPEQIAMLTSDAAHEPAEVEHMIEHTEPQPMNGQNAGIGEEMRRWQHMVEKRVRSNKPVRDFESDIIPAALNGAIAGQLESAKTIDDIRAVFKMAADWETYP